MNCRDLEGCLYVVHYRWNTAQPENKVRGAEFGMRKISPGMARTMKGSREPIILGNLDSIKGWCYATDYMRGIWMMMQQDYPDDFVLGIRELQTVRGFEEVAFRVADLNITWKGSEVNEIGVSITPKQ